MEKIDKEPNFKVGDWVIMDEDYLNSVSVNIRKILIKKYNYPQKIEKISTYSKYDSTYYLDGAGHNTKYIYRFRLATEKEIKIQQLKETFCKTGA
jgi:hypothetical protein